MSAAALAALAHNSGRALGGVARRASTASASGTAMISGTAPAVSGAAAVAASVTDGTITAGTITTGTTTTAAGTASTIAVCRAGLSSPHRAGGRETPLGTLRYVEVGEQVRR